MSLIKVNDNQKKALAVASILGAIVAVWFLKYYIGLIAFAAVMAFLFNPVYQWLIGKGRNLGQAALLTFLTSLLVIIIPIVVIGFFTILQIESLANSLANSEYDVEATNAVNETIETVNSWLTSLGSSFQLTVEGITSKVSEAAEAFSQQIVGNIFNFVSGFFNFIVIGIIYIYVFMSILRHQRKIIETAKKLNPLGDQTSVLYLERISAMTKATVRGQFIIAFLQGTESAIVLSIAGLNELFFFFWMLLTLLSVIPLGAGIVTIPIGIVMILTGHVWQGVLVILNHLLVVTNIDNVVRPKLVPSNARLDPALMILAVFSGMAYFGFFGIVIGPVIMIVLLTTMQIFLEVYRDTEAIDRTRGQPKRGILKKFGRQITKRVPRI